MAERIYVQVVDDIDGKVLREGEGETIHFSVDGVSYEIDLSVKHAREFRKSMSPYTSSATRINGKRRGGKTSSHQEKPTRIDPFQSKHIRQWANANGYSIGKKGRIPTNVLNAYNAAN
jgi:hypothetical protein